MQVHTGSRGFGHGLATNYFEMAREERPDAITDIDLGYFTPESRHYKDYLNAVAAGGNYAILNRLVIFEEVAEAFREVFGSDLELIYEISHNLVQKEWHPDFGDVWVHRKGATRAFPAGHPFLKDTALGRHRTSCFDSGKQQGLQLHSAPAGGSGEERFFSEPRRGPQTFSQSGEPNACHRDKLTMSMRPREFW